MPAEQPSQRDGRRKVELAVALGVAAAAGAVSFAVVPGAAPTPVLVVAALAFAAAALLAELFVVSCSEYGQRKIELCLDGAVWTAAFVCLPGRWALGASVTGCAMGLLVSGSSTRGALRDLANFVISISAAFALTTAALGGDRSVRAALAVAALLLSISLDVASLLLVMLHQRLVGTRTAVIRPALIALGATWPYLLPVAALGTMAGLFAAAVPWAAVLEVGAGALILMLARAQHDHVRNAARLRALLTISSEMQSFRSAAEVRALVEGTVTEFLRVPYARIGGPPEGNEIGVPFDTREQPAAWLVAAPRGRFSRRLGRDVLVQLAEISSIGAPAMDVAIRHERTSHAAEHDALTGLLNRAAFTAELERTLAAEVGGSHLLFIDLDGFKQVNDRHGHDAGDHVLRVTATRLRGVVRDDDVVARLGGDEFTVLLPRCVEVAVAERVAQRLVEALAAPVELPDGAVVRVSGSVGLASSATHATTEALLRAADAAMYAVKHAGKGHWLRSA